MKKFLSILLIILISTIGFAGCEKAPKEKSSNTPDCCTTNESNYQLASSSFLPSGNFNIPTL